MTIRRLKPSSEAHTPEKSKRSSGPPPEEAPQLQLQDNMKRTLVESRDQILGFEGIATGDTLETASSEETTIMAAGTEIHHRKLVANNGMARGRITRRMPASVSRYLANADDGQTLLRLSKLHNPSPYEHLFSDLDSLGLAPREQSPNRKYKEDQPSRGTPQHRNIEQSLDEILYLPSCG